MLLTEYQENILLADKNDKESCIILGEWLYQSKLNNIQNARLQRDRFRRQLKSLKKFQSHLSKFYTQHQSSLQLSLDGALDFILNRNRTGILERADESPKKRHYYQSHQGDIFP